MYIKSPNLGRGRRSYHWPEGPQPPAGTRNWRAKRAIISSFNLFVGKLLRNIQDILLDILRLRLTEAQFDQRKDRVQGLSCMQLRIS